MSEEEIGTSEEKKEEDVFTILIATDIHLGFEENDPIRNQDTFDTFEEILQIAEAEEVDFILLGGDLFHHSRPSPYCMYKCTELLKKYCLGDKPVGIEFLSDPKHNFNTLDNPTVNYEDPNLNISIPVFSIHGNHDDPTGQRQISAMDLLSTAGLVNYFGRWNSHDMVEIEPILLKKGQTKLALFGLSHIKDERLGRLFLDKKVKMLAPDQENDWFNLLVWHQNRATRGVKNFIPDDTLPQFLDLVIWGHEHDCRIEPEERGSGVYISQPGSSVATSLALGEAIPKKIGILKIHKKTFMMTPIHLKTVRPFIFDELVLKEPNEMDMEESGLTYTEMTMELVTNKISSMLAAAKQLGRTRKVTENPLIRLNVKYKDERQVFNAIRFGQSYIGQVANPEDMVKCQAIKDPVRRKKNDGSDAIDVPEILADRVEDIVLQHFTENDTLICFPVDLINEAVKKYIDSQDVEAPILISDHLIKETIEKLETDMPEVEDIDKFIKDFKNSKQRDTVNFVQKILDDPGREKKRNLSSEQEHDDNDILRISDDSDVEQPSTSSKPRSGPGSRGRRGSSSGRSSSSSRGSRGTRRGRGRAK